jgi:hypothetical protein
VNGAHPSAAARPGANRPRLEDKAEAEPRAELVGLVEVREPPPVVDLEPDRGGHANLEPAAGLASHGVAAHGAPAAARILDRAARGDGVAKMLTWIAGESGDSGPMPPGIPKWVSESPPPEVLMTVIPIEVPISHGGPTGRKRCPPAPATRNAAVSIPNFAIHATLRGWALEGPGRERRLLLLSAAD